MTTGMITVEEHLATVLAGARPLAPHRVPIDQAHGRVLAEDLRSTVPSPFDDNASMDGYAVRRADVLGATMQQPVALRVVGEVAAGSALDPALAPGEAVRIMTGGPLPSDADAVVPIERTADADWAADPVRILEEPEPGAFVRRAGGDLAVGDLVLARGIRLTARALASAVGAGVGDLLVHPAPRVAIIATGDELADPGAPLSRGRVHDANSVLVAAACTELGADVVHRDRAGDAPGELDAAVRRALGASVDLLVLTGGVSAGAHDPVTRLALGFAKVAMQPGKPQAFGRIEGVPVFGLPGNPVSVAVSFEVFVRPFLDVLQGLDPVRTTEPAIAADGWRTPPGRRQYQPVVATREHGVLHVRPASDRGSGSHLIGRLARADGFAIVPAEVEEIRVGDAVEVMLG